jgi:hypothetical protein
MEKIKPGGDIDWYSASNMNMKPIIQINIFSNNAWQCCYERTRRNESIDHTLI